MMRPLALALLGLAAVSPGRDAVGAGLVATPGPAVELPRGSTLAIVETDAVRVALGTPSRHAVACRWADELIDPLPSCGSIGAVSETVWRVVHARP